MSDRDPGRARPVHPVRLAAGRRLGSAPSGDGLSCPGVIVSAEYCRRRIVEATAIADLDIGSMRQRRPGGGG